MPNAPFLYPSFFLYHAISAIFLWQVILQLTTTNLALISIILPVCVTILLIMNLLCTAFYARKRPRPSSARGNQRPESPRSLSSCPFSSWKTCKKAPRKSTPYVGFLSERHDFSRVRARLMKLVLADWYWRRSILTCMYLVRASRIRGK